MTMILMIIVCLQQVYSCDYDDFDHDDQYESRMIVTIPAVAAIITVVIMIIVIMILIRDDGNVVPTISSFPDEIDHHKR